MTKQRLQELSARIERIKRELLTLQDMRPGSLTRQYKDPAHQRGSYYQLSYTRQMSSRTEYVSREQLPEVRRQIGAYKRFKALTGEWIALSIERCRLLMKRRP